MEIFWAILLLGIGIVIIVKGGDLFVDAASWFAEISGIPKLIVGATVVSFATTLPELLVSIFASVEGHAADLVEAGSGLGKVDIAIGNAIGSVTANLGLIFAIAMIAMPTVIRRKDYLLKMLLMLSAAGVVVGFGLIADGISVLPSILLLIIFGIAMYDNVHEAIVSVRAERAEALANGEVAVREKATAKTIVIHVVKFLLGAVGIILGARLLVDNGSTLARLCGVSERVISVTIIAVGTSLPELVTTITAIVRKPSSLSAGNIIGANIIDLTLILPACALIYGGKLPVIGTVGILDMPACLLIGLICVVPTLITRKFARWQGICVLLVYVTYVVITVAFGDALASAVAPAVALMTM